MPQKRNPGSTIWKYTLIEIQSSKSQICECYGFGTFSLENEDFLMTGYHDLKKNDPS